MHTWSKEVWLPCFLVKLRLFTPGLTTNHPDEHTAGVRWAGSCKQPQPYVMAWVLCKNCHPGGSRIDGCGDQHGASLGVQMRVGVHQCRACSSQTLTRRGGAPRPPLSPGMLHRDALVHEALGNSGHHPALLGG